MTMFQEQQMQTVHTEPSLSATCRQGHPRRAVKHIFSRWALRTGLEQDCHKSA